MIKLAWFAEKDFFYDTIKNLLVVSVLILILLQIFDVLTTIRFIGALGIGVEINPLAVDSYLINGVAGLLVLKLLILLIAIPAFCIIVLPWRNQDYWVKYGLTVLCLSFCAFLNPFYIDIVIHNLLV